MSIRSSAILASVLIGLQMFAMGQIPPAQTTDKERATPAPALSGVVGMDTEAAADETGIEPPNIPTMLGGPKMPVLFSSEQARSNYLHGGVNVGVEYDGNPFLASSGGEGTPIYSIFPNIALERTTSRTRWTLSYAAGLTVNQELSSRNQGAHDLNFDSQYRLSPHVRLHVAEDFSLTTGLFDSGTVTGGASGAGGPNTSVITPLSQQRSSSTVVETDYHFALKDVVGASGFFHDLHFNDAAVGSTLVDTRTTAGGAFWLHGLFRHDWAGLSYRFQRLTFDPNGETRVHSVMVVNTLSLPSRFKLTAFVGPEYSDNHGLAAANGGSEQVSQFSDWSIGGGVDATWQKDRTTVVAGYSRLINDGGGTLGAVHLQNVHADLRQELYPGWVVGLGASYGGNKALTVPFSASATSINLTSVGVSLAHNLGRSLGFGFGYFHDFQEQSGSSNVAQNFNVHRNRFSVGLSYQWAKALGR
jgi:hypothetical protein